jgi:hypothetical protein
VVVAPASSARDVRRGLDEFVVAVMGLRGHLLCLRQDHPTLTRVTMARKRISAVCLFREMK